MFMMVLTINDCRRMYSSPLTPDPVAREKESGLMHTIVKEIESGYNHVTYLLH